ncbi:MAG: methionine biosynthesis protein MetW [Kiritimatiellaeota bacterium]|nr:methionine biosynthesis protein MetW [Kiritimatiellota bacterium]
MLRTDYRLVLDLVESGARVLDLGCGNGNLLWLLKQRKQVTGYGVEISGDRIIECVEKGLSVFQGDIDEGLRDFEDQSFDYVVLNQTLPVIRRPDYVIEEMLRVGRRGIVSFANFAHWSIRLRLLFSGRMPVDDAIPFEWYETPNIHHLTIRDFHFFCRRFKIAILDSWFFCRLERGRPRRRRCCPNWTAAFALYVVTRAQ